MSKRNRSKLNDHVVPEHQPKTGVKRRKRSIEKQRARRMKQLYRDFVDRFGEFMPPMIGN